MPQGDKSSDRDPKTPLDGGVDALTPAGAAGRPGVSDPAGRAGVAAMGGVGAGTTGVDTLAGGGAAGDASWALTEIVTIRTAARRVATDRIPR
jgi:hypothetical protein